MDTRVLLGAACFGLCATLTAAPSVAAEQETETKAELSQFGTAKLSLHDAISAAELKIGGQAINASFQTRDGASTYRVNVYSGDTVTQVDVNPKTGEALPVKALKTSQLDREDAQELAALPHTKVTLDDAAISAERKAGGKAVDVELEAAGPGKVGYDAQVVKNGTVQRVWVDSVTGNATAK